MVPNSTSFVLKHRRHQVPSLESVQAPLGYLD